MLLTLLILAATDFSLTREMTTLQRFLNSIETRPLTKHNVLPTIIWRNMSNKTLVLVKKPKVTGHAGDT